VPVPCQSEQGRVPEAVAIGRLRCKGVERDKGEGPKVPADVDRLQCQVARGDIDLFDVSPRDGDGTVSGGGYRFPPEVIHQAIGPGALLSGEAWHLVLRQIGRIIGSRTTMPRAEQAGPR
jgi:hypothetical protein